MTAYDYDLITIGAGSGGVRASRMAAATGARVAVIESLRTGGTCVMRGCVPKKLLVYGSHFAHDFEDSVGFGWESAKPGFKWSNLIDAKNKELDRLEGVYHNLLKGAGVEEIFGKGKLVGPHSVEVDGTTHTAETILIATGGWPSLPDVPGIAHAITSNEALDLAELPKRIAVVGGGYIAVEFAGIFNALGSEVHVIIRADNILRGFDDAMRDGLRDEMTKKGIHIHSGTTVSAVVKKPAGDLTMQLDGADDLNVDQVMYATGRAPNTKDIGLEAVGIATNSRGAIAVDDYSKTSIDHIYAIGDVTDRINLTPVALAEGMAFVNTVYGNNPTAADRRNVASAVFSQPPIATVGLTEAEAARHGPVDVYESRFRNMKHTLSGRDEKSVMKLIVDRQTDRVVGCHMMGSDSPEIIQGLAIAIKCGATKAQFDATIGIHPTAAEEFVTMRQKRD
ncbi:MAG: glutathione-disulfide reductase [Rhodospirillales bacterium]|nr:glutathione-disulfide reductase [Rhodospirillales bacterium]